MKNLFVRKLVLAGMFLALGFVLPFVTGGNVQLGVVLSPMHIPVLLCGFVCGWQYGLLIGIITPLLRSFILSMPPIFPVAVTMAFELATYGLVAGLLYKLLPKKNIYIYISLITSMIAGRIVLAVTTFVLAQVKGNPFVLKMFITDSILQAYPGMIIQIVLIPIILIALKKAGLTNDLRDMRKN